MREEPNNQFIGRMIFLGIVQIIFIFVLLGRMYQLQIFQGSYYQLLAEGNRIATRPMIPLRGQVHDRNGIPLALNNTTFRVVFLTDKRTAADETLQALSVFIPLSTDEIKDVLSLIAKKRSLDSVIVKDNLTWEEVSAIELHAAELPGISIEIGSSRQYPKQELGAHLLGYVSSPSEKEQAGDEVLAIPGLKVGKVGLEKYLDKELRGVPGHNASEINAKRKIVRELYQMPSLAGADVRLTVDSRLQDHAQEVLSRYESASAVVIDIHNGDILTLVSSPSFDPNLFPRGIGHKPWSELQENPYVPLTNKAISGRYAPGSTLKLFVALAALQSGVIHKNDTIYCPGHVSVGSHKFHCMHQHGHINVSRAIIESCDVFFYEVGKRIGIDQMAVMMRDFGFGAGGLEDFPHCKKGLVPSKEWKQEKKNAKWTVSDTILTSIGQGYALATPLELAVAMARLANGGLELRPRLVGQDSVEFPQMTINKDHLKTVLDAANGVVNAPNGTAFRNRILTPGFEMAGKTGTSQVRRITLEQRKAGLTKTHHLAWKYREHGLFIGYASHYAIAVVVEHAGGSSLAVQAARDILEYAQKLERKGMQEGHSGTKYAPQVRHPREGGDPVSFLDSKILGPRFRGDDACEMTAFLYCCNNEASHVN